MIKNFIVLYSLSLFVSQGQGQEAAEIAEAKLRMYGVKFNSVGLYALFLNPKEAEKTSKGNFHVVINDSRRLGKINLKYLQDLPNLKEIFVGPDFPDDWCSELETITQLEGLFFSGNYNEGIGLTNRGLASVAKLTNLQALSLLSTKVTDNGLRHLKELKKLRWLSLSGAQNITNQGLAHLKDLENLEDLSLEGTQISAQGLVHLKGLTKIRRLRLPNEEQQGLPGGLKALANMKDLRRLDARGLCANDDDMKALRTMTKLKELDLCYTKVTDKGLEHLAGLTALEELDLFGTGVTGDGLKHLRHLKNLWYLDLGFCPLEDKAAEHLRHMTQLGYLGITMTNMSKKTIEQLKRELPKTTIR